MKPFAEKLTACEPVLHLSWHRCAHVQAMAEVAAAHVVRACRAAVESRGFFSLGLSGGQTPLALFKLLRSQPWLDRFDWAHTRFFWVDERCVPPSHPQSNYGMTKRELFDHVPAPQGIFPMQGAMAPDQAVSEYIHVLHSHVACVDTHVGAEGDMVPCSGNIPSSVSMPCFDCLLLGMGADGHTASLFPNDPLAEQVALSAAVATTWVPKLQSQRLTLTLPVINRARLCLVMAAGAEKKTALQQALALLAPAELPIQRVRPIQGDLVWLTAC